MARPRKEVTIEQAQKIVDDIRVRVANYYDRKKDDTEFIEKRRAYYKVYAKELYYKKKAAKQALANEQKAEKQQ